MGSSQSSLAVHVKLSGKGLRDLEKDLKQPHLLTAFPKLESLDLSRNKIEHVPHSIQQDVQKSPLVIEHLTLLDLSKNRLSEVPECVYLFINLKELSMAGNELVSISDKILTFYRLHLDTLILSDNKLKRLPYAIHRLHALRVIAVENNELTYLPNNIARLEHLEEITFLPNPFADQHMTSDFDDMKELLRFLRSQKVPPTYLDEARRALEADKLKAEKLTADQRIVRELLKYKEGLEELEKWMTKEHSAENLTFYKEVRHFRKKYNSTAEIRTTELVQDAKKIFDTYISPQSPDQVNLPGEAVAGCIKMFSDTFNFPRGINQFIFEEAYKASFELMVRDSFQRFRLSEVGKDLLSQLSKIQKKKHRHE